jgi:voltage-gated potassium channel
VVRRNAPEWRRLYFGLAALATVVVVGTIGYVLLGFGALDAMYQTVTTVATVGFREVEPLDGAGQVFTMVLILVGVGTTLFTFSAVVEIFVEGHFQDAIGRRRMQRTIDSMRDHTIICGWGRVGSTIARYLQASGRDVVVVDREAERIDACPVDTCIVGDATDDDVLRRAGIDRATALVAAVETDEGNLFITLSARRLRPDLFIVSRVRRVGTEDKLLQAGADRVVNPQSIGGARMAAFVLQPNVAEFVDVVMHDRNLEFRLEEIVVPARTTLDGATLRDAQIREQTGAMVLAIRDETGTFTTNPTAETTIRAGQVLITIGTPAQLCALEQLVGS